MPRQIRFQLAEIAHHVVQRGHNRQPVFFADEDHSYYLECLSDAAQRFGCRIHAYVLMPNHVHLLVTPSQPSGISRMMQSVGRRYVRYINFRHLRTGTLWEGRYRASLVSGGEYLLRCYRHIETNPVRALLAGDPADYRWSSCRHNLLGKPDFCVSPHPDFLALGAQARERQLAYRALLQAPLDNDALRQIRSALLGSRAYGSPQFEKELEALLQRRITPARRGRPPKARAQPETTVERPLRQAA